MSSLKVTKLQGIVQTNNEITVPSNHRLIVPGILRVGSIQSSGGISIWSPDPSGNISMGGNLNVTGSISCSNLSASSKLNLPIWTTLTRPTTNLVVGRIGYNTTISDIDIWNGTSWITVSGASSSSTVSLPTGYVLAMDMNSSTGGLINGSTWTLSQPAGTAGTYISNGGVLNTGYYSNSGRPPGGTPGVSNYFYRINEMPLLSGSNLTFCIWYKGTQNVAPQTYGPSVPLFGDTRNSVYGGFGISNGRAEFRDSGNAYQSSVSVIDGTWKHIVFSIDSSRNLRIYINGTLDSSYSAVSINAANTRTSDIAAHYPYSGFVAPEAVDGVVVYDKVLSGAEVTQVYNSYISSGTSVSATGGVVTNIGAYKYHTFTSIGTATFTVSSGGPVEYVIVGGGGAGGGGDVGSGGGAGGFRTNVSGFKSGGNTPPESYMLITPGTYNVVVGGGGTGVADSNSNGGNGGSSSFNGITSLGGGGGAGWARGTGNSGGSGAGATANGSVGTGTSGQGFNGGTGLAGSNYPQGGGGGAGGVGQNAPSQSAAGAGGPGLPNPFGSATQIGQLFGGTYYLAGGGGGGVESNATVGDGGLGGGGIGGRQNSELTAAAGLPNTGGGGGGEDPQAGANGGSGVVIIRYLA
jgi:hypothetical protein